MSRITILSDGSWGTALSTVLCRNGHDVTMWGPFPEYLEQVKKTGVNSRFLPAVKLPEPLKFEANIRKAVEGRDFLVLASPTQFARGVIWQLKDHFDAGTHKLINVAKGIENDSLLRISEICGEILGSCDYSVLSGPSHAEEVSREAPTALVAASNTAGMAGQVQELFMNDFFRVYTSSDVVGVELGGALKNVMAIAAGVIDGMQLGDNPKAALITRGISEMGRLGAALGGDPLTFSGLSGIGDLIVTCCSGHSRNRHVGEELGRGKTLRQILEGMGMVVAEGVKTTLSAYQLARQAGVECPIINEIYSVLYEGKASAEAVNYLMTRPSKPEAK
ncbi:MAG: NAD(P)-dependent glycerol-3-phosphate dehydrogenase [Lentisphaerae bacterium]|nr:NAD(P)-dependent glycerol-3-phosphate dehydrogenase [Lentisphaerota bacterium]MCP4101158.1 NAD(P)-dependent glycerol-3-phosphate dehydrogenase [Lentisphaerota bacterium]